LQKKGPPTTKTGSLWNEKASTGERMTLKGETESFRKTGKNGGAILNPEKERSLKEKLEKKIRLRCGLKTNARRKGHKRPEEKGKIATRKKNISEGEGEGHQTIFLKKSASRDRYSPKKLNGSRRKVDTKDGQKWAGGGEEPWSHP